MIPKLTFSCFFFLSIVTSLCNIAQALNYNVIHFGAKPDGQTDATHAFVKAWTSACYNSDSSSTIYVPDGVYIINALKFQGPCKNPIDIRINGTLVAPPPENYTGVDRNSGYWILFIRVNRVRVIGGTLDAKGASFWECKASGSKNCLTGARSITFNWANDIVIDGLTSVNSQLMHIVINSCKNVMVHNVKTKAPELSPNTDGIHVQSSNGVIITQSNIQTGDDCISIGPGTSNMLMDDIHCGPGHGVSIGSLGRNFDEDGVENVTLRNSVFSRSDNGLRIKTWARPSKGFVRNILYQNIVMNHVENPIIIDQNYCPNNLSCPAQSSGIKIEEVRYENVQGTSATQVAMIFDCSSSNPCSGITLRDVKLTYTNATNASSFCNNIGGKSGADIILKNTCLE